MGQCPSCRAWNTFIEEPAAKADTRRSGSSGNRQNRPVRISEISLEQEDRIPTGFSELDRVLGGGLVVGSLILLGGDPGIGKSTLLLEAADRISREEGRSVLYVSGEESLKQTKMRAERIGQMTGDLRFLSETNVDNVGEILRAEKPSVCVIDSIQTMYTDSVTASPGSVSQVRESAASLLRIAKDCGIAVFIVGHVTKDGAVAGPKILEHMVDAVLYFEGENRGNLRILHGQKNRFGSTNEIAVFEMTGAGLKEVLNPSELLLSGRPEHASGSVVTCGMEGTRPLLIEIQGLAVPTSFGLPRRTANGVDYNRMNLLLAIIERRLGLPMSKFDAYLNIAGGLRITEPSSDLAVILALISSVRNLVVPDDVMIFGEVGLAGEVRAVPNAVQRIEEAARLGFRSIVLPAYHMSKLTMKKEQDVHLIPVRNIREALTVLRREDKSISS